MAAYAGAYTANHACAISVLTEPTHFKGSLENARIARRAGLPVLRKDFIFDKRQLSEVQADLVLLIAALGIDLESFMDMARARGMEPLVEVHSGPEMDRALKTDARIIGINNRNLSTFQVDLETTARLRPLIPEGIVVVAESGVHSRADVRRMAELGVDAVLVGEALVTAADVGQQVRELVGEGRGL